VCVRGSPGPVIDCVFARWDHGSKALGRFGFVLFWAVGGASPGDARWLGCRSRYLWRLVPAYIREGATRPRRPNSMYATPIRGTEGERTKLGGPAPRTTPRRLKATSGPPHFHLGQRGCRIQFPSVRRLFPFCHLLPLSPSTRLRRPSSVVRSSYLSSPFTSRSRLLGCVWSAVAPPSPSLCRVNGERVLVYPAFHAIALVHGHPPGRSSRCRRQERPRPSTLPRALLPRLLDDSSQVSNIS
jgi:hypothetical protein